MKAIINMTTAFLLLLMFLFGWSLVTYNESPEKYQWIDSNGEFKTETYDVTVSYNLDTPIDDLNGYSLREVFYDNNLVQNPDFLNGVSNWTLLRMASYSVSDNLFSYTPNAQYGQIEQSVSFTANQWHYSWAIVKTTRTTVNSNRNGISPRYHSGSGEFENLSTKWRYGGQANWVERVTDTATANWLLIEIKSMGRVNLDALGIGADRSTLDYWYSEYQRLQENQIENYKELGSTVESSWQFLTGYFTTLVEVIDAQVQVILNPFEALAEGLSIITVPIFG